MNFYDVVEKRRSIRDFERIEIGDDVIERIIRAGLKAPANGNMRNWHFVVIKDNQIVLQLIDIIPKDISEKDMDRLLKEWNISDPFQQASYRYSVPGQYQMLADSSAIIVPLFKSKFDIMKPENLSYLNSFASIWCCIENIFLAATAEGYACNLRIPLGNEGAHARKVLGFPEDYLMPCFIGLGKPSKDAKILEHKEINAKERIHIDKWDMENKIASGVN